MTCRILVPQPRTELVSLAVKAWSSNHWTAREFPNLKFIFKRRLYITTSNGEGFLNGVVVKNPPANEGETRDLGLSPESGRSLGDLHGNPPQYSCLEKSMEGGTWRATIHGVTRVRYDWAHTHTTGNQNSSSKIAGNSGSKYSAGNKITVLNPS